MKVSKRQTSMAPLPIRRVLLGALIALSAGGPSSMVALGFSTKPTKRVLPSVSVNRPQEGSFQPAGVFDEQEGTFSFPTAAASTTRRVGEAGRESLD